MGKCMKHQPLQGPHFAGSSDLIIALEDSDNCMFIMRIQGDWLEEKTMCSYKTKRGASDRDLTARGTRIEIQSH